jgi:hypothetical protein
MVMIDLVNEKKSLGVISVTCVTETLLILAASAARIGRITPGQSPCREGEGDAAGPALAARL